MPRNNCFKLFLFTCKEKREKNEGSNNKISKLETNFTYELILKLTTGFGQTIHD